MAELDRKMNRPLIKRKIIISLFLIIVLALSLITIAFPKSEVLEPPIHSRVSYSAHAPIYIDGNSGFTNASGVVWGSGTVDDPYIIENWNINASSANGIEIRNTNAYFIIRYCYIHDGEMGSQGIYLYFCENGTLQGNDCYNNWIGIELGNSNHNTIINNNCSTSVFCGIFFDYSSSNYLFNNYCHYCDFGICFFQRCDDNILIENKCNFSSSGGISLSQICNGNIVTENICKNGIGGIGIDGNDNSLINNTCSENYVGISLSGSNNILNSNICNFNIWDGIGLDTSDNNLLLNNTCNFNNENGISLIDACINNSLINNTCSNNDYGIFIWRSNGNMLANNTCNSNNYGIDLYRSSNNTIVNNTIFSNGINGISLSSMSRINKIWNNTLIYNNGTGDIFDPNHIQAYDDGIQNQWSGTDGYGNYWSDWTAPDNDFDGIVDIPYNISGSAGTKDYFPRTIPGNTPPIPEFSDIIIPIIGLFGLIFIIRIHLRKT